MNQQDVDPCSHTPGPWALNDYNGIGIAKVGIFAITAPCVPDIGPGLSREQIAANARLIVSAPELLDALRGMVGLVQLIESREPDLKTNHRFLTALSVITNVEESAPTEIIY
jgi:hypothetical protein